MTASSESLSPIPVPGNLASFGRGLVLRFILLLIVGGSQIGMLVVAAVYVQMGERLESMLTPEAVLGSLAILLTILIMRVHPLERQRDRILLWLLIFLAYCSITELLRPDLRIGNVTTFISIGAFYLIGRTIGREVIRDGNGVIPWTGALLAIYAFWYLAMLVFFIRGDLGFYGALPYSDLARLQFTEGFRATEIAIHVGFQIPVLLYVLLQVHSAVQRMVAVVLLFCAFIFVLATASAAALAAIAIVLMTFLFGRIGMSMRTLAIAAAGSLLLGALVLNYFKDGIVGATEAKFEDYEAGEGARALIYGELVLIIVNEPMGIGKGRFVETSALVWSGKNVYPHQNFLGIGAELGVPAMILWGVFVATAFIALARRAWSPSSDLPRTLRMIATVALAMFLFQQFRGMFQDTWTVRETYLWLGLALGATSLRRTAGAPDAELPRS